ncbi:MAG: hypothetical protein KGZ30_01130 [Anaplasmataceae bacterium]|nr:hypothetical protein [Anaplasmataceae bacterium]
MAVRSVKSGKESISKQASKAKSLKSAKLIVTKKESAAKFTATKISKDKKVSLSPTFRSRGGGSLFKNPISKKKVTRREVVVRRPSKTLERSEINPIITPKSDNAWESWQTFNPAAVYEGGKFHLLYRAIGEGGYSVLGYASSSDGHVVDERHPFPAYVRSSEKKKLYEVPILTYASGGGGWNGGAEDPRLTRIDDDLYLIYTAFDGWSSLRLALTSISLDDFLKKNWDWKEPVFISPPMEIHKNWVLFPEKVQGKFAILHDIDPEISIDYFDSLDELDGKKYIHSKYQRRIVKDRWDSIARGVGPPPIKTPYGWLVLYHAIDHRDPGRYKLGAMILDLKDPTKILHRASRPILEPDEEYENNGKPGVIYSCGAVVVDGILYVYYGGADAVTCVATADFKKFVGDLMKDVSPLLKRRSSKKK